MKENAIIEVCIWSFFISNIIAFGPYPPIYFHLPWKTLWSFVYYIQKYVYFNVFHVKYCLLMSQDLPGIQRQFVVTNVSIYLGIIHPFKIQFSPDLVLEVFFGKKLVPWGLKRMDLIHHFSKFHNYYSSLGP